MIAPEDQPILIVDPDVHFRDRLHNFLLSAGYENVDSAKSFTEALERVEESEYHIVVVNAVSNLEGGIRSADNITLLSPKTKVILMVGPEDQPVSPDKHRRQFLIKATFTRDLLYLLEKDA